VHIDRILAVRAARHPVEERVVDTVLQVLEEAVGQRLRDVKTAVRLLSAARAALGAYVRSSGGAQPSVELLEAPAKLPPRRVAPAKAAPPEPPAEVPTEPPVEVPLEPPAEVAPLEKPLPARKYGGTTAIMAHFSVLKKGREILPVEVYDRLIKDGHDVSRDYVTSCLGRLARRGHLSRPRRGVYARRWSTPAEVACKVKPTKKKAVDLAKELGLQ